MPRTASGCSTSLKWWGCLRNKPMDSQEPAIGVLLINIGTPERPDTGSVRKFLMRFLMDRRVISIPAVARMLLVRGIIGPLRSKRSAREYRLIWQAGGSPLTVHSQAFAQGLQAELGGTFAVHLAMRYSQPDIAEVLGAMQARQYQQIIVMPMYPHNASSTTGSAAEEVFRQLARWDSVPGISVIAPFYDQPEFIRSMAHRISAFSMADYDTAVFSYHGLPASHLPACISSCGNGACTASGTAASRHCYKRQCLATTDLLAAAAGIAPERCVTSFQSRMSKSWIGPFTDTRAEQLLAEGKTRLLVISPAFAADCLETLGEVGIHLRGHFLAAGGTRFDTVPCLNGDAFWTAEAAGLVRRHAHFTTI